MKIADVLRYVKDSDSLLQKKLRSLHPKVLDVLFDRDAHLVTKAA
jgi:hypothetical protein